jgi:hypothetical protein
VKDNGQAQICWSRSYKYYTGDIEMICGGPRDLVMDLDVGTTSPLLGFLPTGGLTAMRIWCDAGCSPVEPRRRVDYRRLPRYLKTARRDLK